MDILKALGNKSLGRILLLLNGIVAIVVFYIFRSQLGGDATTYLGLADGITHGLYTYWYFLDTPFPDSFRNPGYPLFLSFFRLFTDSVLVIQIFQLILYIISLYLAVEILRLLFNLPAVESIFLLLMLPGIYVAYYISAIFPEILVTFLLLTYFYADLKIRKDSWLKVLVLALLAGFIFQVRPVFIFVPVIASLHKFFYNRDSTSFLKQVVLLLLFFATMIPYGLWNRKHHGVFKVTSIEGGGGVFHLGYWAMKLPDYYEYRYWGNYCPEEMIPFTKPGERKQNIDRFNAEWDSIDAGIRHLLNSGDTLMLKAHEQHPELFRTYNSEYAIAREKALLRFTIEDIKSDLPFYLKVKLYSAIRLWVTGIPLKDYREATAKGKILLLYPFVITLVTFLAALILIPMAWHHKPEWMRRLSLMLIITAYFGLIHIPFTIQSRYTIPVRIELLMIISVSAYIILDRKKVKYR